jgi:hypothetical protein
VKKTLPVVRATAPPPGQSAVEVSRRMAALRPVPGLGARARDCRVAPAGRARLAVRRRGGPSGRAAAILAAVQYRSACACCASVASAGCAKTLGTVGWWAPGPITAAPARLTAPALMSVQVTTTAQITASGASGDGHAIGVVGLMMPSMMYESQSVCYVP